MAPMLSGRIVLITGASSGIGARFAQVCAGAGAAVVLGARRVDRLEALCESIDNGGGRALAVAMDVTDEASVIAAYDAAEGRRHIATWPRRRMLEEDSLDATLLYLLSDASRNVTGSDFVIDDGQSL